MNGLFRSRGGAISGGPASDNSALSLVGNGEACLSSSKCRPCSLQVKKKRRSTKGLFVFENQNETEFNTFINTSFNTPNKIEIGIVALTISKAVYFSNHMRFESQNSHICIDNLKALSVINI